MDVTMLVTGVLVTGVLVTGVLVTGVLVTGVLVTGVSFVYRRLKLRHQYVVSLSKTLCLHCFSRLSCKMSTRWGQPREWCSVL